MAGANLQGERRAQRAILVTSLCTHGVGLWQTLQDFLGSRRTVPQIVQRLMFEIFIFFISP
jgi:hypothetical protein